MYWSGTYMLVYTVYGSVYTVVGRWHMQYYEHGRRHDLPESMLRHCRT